jgi:4,5-DOPA dioxygenase extradiol
MTDCMPALFIGHGSPTNEHFLPLLYILAMQDPSDTQTFFCDKVTLGSISMRSLMLA